ncbi:MAG: aldolase/citrate lyase family protein [Corticimicrobacter sp.]|uniref:HpcH/HpaI aldolase family protein n=1 Tax=Corticimicrobacter sp. TaxID=2678536 RepID=UPI0032DA6CB1
MELRTNRFKHDLGRRQQLGMFSTLGGALLTELLGDCGFDWILIDTEHSPNELNDVVHQLQALADRNVSPIVRPAWLDMVLTKRLLDAGAQTLLFPYIQNAEQAAQAVSFTRYPPYGVRGVSGSSRAAGYGMIPGYFSKIEQELAVLVQIETIDALQQLEAIAAVEGVDGVFIGPADLAASMGHLGNIMHSEVQQALDDGFARLKALGKPSGYLTTNEEDATRRLAQGVSFVGVGTDTSIISRAATALTARMRA